MPGTAPLAQDPNFDATQTQNVKAAHELHAHNKKEHRSSLTLQGCLLWPNGKAIESGTNVQFLNKGFFSGKWIIERVHLSIQESKFVTMLELRKCIDNITPGGAL